MRRQFDTDDGNHFGEASRYTAHLDRGWSLLERGDYQRARNSAHQALQLHDEMPDAAMLLAAISLAEGDPESSLEWYERAIDQDADYVEAQLAAAQLLLYDLDDPARAIARAETARELDEATTADRLDFGVLELEALLSLGQPSVALERLDLLHEASALEELLHPETDRRQIERLLQEFAIDADPELDPEELEATMARVVALTVRLARVCMEVGKPELAMQWFQRLLRRFGDDADIWYLFNEAAYMLGESVKAAHAALQVLQLDTQRPLPEADDPKQGVKVDPQAVEAITPSAMHRAVIEALHACPDAQLSALTRDPSFVVIVDDAPSFELVLEGVDPRVRALALATRAASGDTKLTALAIYRRNLVRSIHPAVVDLPDPALLHKELALAVFDELAVFYGFDDERRARMGLPKAEWPSNPGEHRSARGLAANAAPAAVEVETPPAKATKKKAAKKKTATKKKAAKKKTATKKKAATKKQTAAKKKTAAKKQTAAKKKTAAKKQTTAKKKPATKKKAAAKKKTAAKKPAKKATKKKAAKKKTAAKK